MQVDWHILTYDQCSLLATALVACSTNILVLQATNTGVRRPGYKAMVNVHVLGQLFYIVQASVYVCTPSCTIIGINKCI